MPARTPEDVDRLFAESLNAGNLDALTALYEPQASLTASPGKSVKSVEVVRRQAGGDWLFAIDEPFGVGH